MINNSIKLNDTWKNSRTMLSLFILLVFSIVYFDFIKDLILYTIHPDHRKYNSHIVFIPLVSGYLLYQKRRQVADRTEYAVVPGLFFIVCGGFLYYLNLKMRPLLNQTDALSVSALSAVVSLIGCFLLLYGTKAFRFARFPLLFLMFVIPIPSVMMGKILYGLQVCSAEVSYGLFMLLGVPVYREGFFFSLPGVSIEIAEACSGMRATLTLLIIGVLASHLFLRSRRRKGAAIFSTLPITILGNGIRIVGLTLLAIHVDMDFLDSRSMPHERGGLLFFLVDLALFAAVLVILAWQERKRGVPFPSGG